MKKKLPKIKIPGRRLTKREATLEAPAENVPRITNETVAAHREEVLGKARKYIYPLQHSKHRIVLITSGLFIALVIGFFSYLTLSLYRFQSTSTTMYRVTQVIPFPIARSGGHFIAYENYLFELRHYMHYYETQQKLDFRTDAGQQQLADFKKRALEKVVNDTYVKELARKNGISVSDKELDDQIDTVRQQNRLGSSEQVLEDVLRDFWGWSLQDFRRSLRQELLAQKVVATLDKATTQRAQAALAELKAGADFAATAKKYSDDQASKDAGGEYGYPIDRTNRDLAARTTGTLFDLRPGQYSDLIDTGYSLEILKTIEISGEKVRAAHIVFNFKDISTYINDLKDRQKTRTYLKV
jgi:parvulin-like peptidyl-prolyl isomerase